MIDSSRYVFLIGAPRSGTNMLRDILTSLPGIETWPCDEINYIWRHGNVTYPSDSFPPELATTRVCSYIQREFRKIAVKSNASLVLEKTCANSLRVPFLRMVAPHARFIFIVRDGVDVVGSARERWTASLDIPYLLRKVRFVPPADLPYYASRYMLNRLHKLGSTDSTLSVWGPVTDEMAEWKEKYTLPQICALQWRACVESADAALSGFSDSLVHRVHYESFVKSPTVELQKVVSFLGEDYAGFDLSRITRDVSAKSVGRGRAQLDQESLQSVLPLIGDTLSRFGYRV